MQVIGTRQYGSEFHVSANVISVTTSPVEVRLLEERHSCMLYNDSDVDIYLGGSTVDDTTGFPLLKGTYLALDLGEGTMYAAVETGTANLRVLEL
jgi:hypothetical protein